MKALVSTLFPLFIVTTALAEGSSPPEGRILFLGDSITFGGTWVVDTECVLRAAHPERKWEFLNLGLSSETVSGLSEEGHAGGKFPRPDLHERLERVLTQTKPDLAVACYGMNCGIYLPLEESRFQAFRNGMEKLHQQVAASGAGIIHLTPAYFDEKRGGHPGYAATLQAYSDWLLSKKKDGWVVLDDHGAMKAALEEGRSHKADFFLAGDGIHPGDFGHWLMARPLLEHWGIKEATGQPTCEAALQALKAPDGLKDLVARKQGILKLAWLSETKHIRPGVPKGLPLEEAKAEAASLEDQIRKLLLR